MELEKALKSQMLSKAPAAPKVPAAPAVIEGTWRNQYNSTAELKVQGSALSGTYTSLVSSAGQTIKGPIVGYVSGDILSFSVLWPTTPESITSWIGQIHDVKGAATLTTLWHLVRNLEDKDEPTGMWTSILTGSDAFTLDAP